MDYIVLRRWFFTAFGIIMFLPLQASHIVGGEITYRCLGDNNYEISMTLYRDCFYGVPYFDRPAYMGFFDQNNERVREVGNNGLLIMSVRNDDTLSPVLENPCYVIPPDVCVHTTTYLDTIHLPFLEGGYTLVYQRCCRNQTILNIVDPDGTGGTYTGFISQKSLEECNNAATFNEWPPFFICVNEPIDFDHSANDPEGDSLVYKLCEPLGGDYRHDPRPVPPFPPPYETVQWIDPPYGLDNMLGGTDPLRIDSETGFLTGTPTTIGQFVVGVCVDEYRDGLLINTTRRDFQFNVGVCGVTTSAFFAADTYCNQLEVEFENLSVNPLEILWIFGDPENPLDSSTEYDPIYTFPDFGEYQVTLIATGVTETCTDTFTKIVELVDVEFEVDVEANRIICTDTLDVEFFPIVSTELGGENSFYWEVSWDGRTSFSSDSTIRITVTGEDSLEVFLRVINDELGCWKTFRFNYATGLLPESGDEFTIEICKGETVSLYPTFTEGRTFLWEPSNYLIDPPDSPNPLAAPEDSITYTVLVSDGICTATVRVEVNVEETKADFQAAENYCNQFQIGFANQSVNASGHLWVVGDLDNPFDSSGDENPTLSFPDFGTYDVTLIALGDTEVCNDTISKEITVLDAPFYVDLEVDRGDCSEEIQLDFNAIVNAESQVESTFNWILTVGDSSMISIDSVVSLLISGEQIIRVQLEVYNEELNCFNNFDFEYETGLILEDGLSFYHFLCEDDTISLFPGYYAGNTYLWSPEEGLLDPPDSPNPRAWPETSTLYTAEIANQNCVGGIEVQIDMVRSDVFSRPDTLCGTRQFTFINPYVNNGNRGVWRFYRNGSLLESRVADTIDYTFINYGDWLVEFRPVGGKPGNCPDTLRKPFFLFELDVDLGLEIERGECADSLELFLTAFPGGPVPGSHEYLWVINRDTFRTKDSTYTAYILAGDTATITAILRNDFGCEFQISDTIVTGLIPEEFRSDSVFICPGDSLFLNPGFSPEYTYLWTPDTWMQAPDTSINPLVTPFSSTTYTGKIENELCAVFYTFDVSVLHLEAELEPQTLCGELTFEIEVPESPGLDYNWYLGDINNPLSTGDSVYFQSELPEFGTFDLFLVISAPGLDCPDTFSTRITAVDFQPITPDIEVIRGECTDSLELTLWSGIPDSLKSGLSLGWFISGDTSINTTGDSISIQLFRVYDLQIELVVTDSLGCFVNQILEYRTGLIPDIFLRDTIEICFGDTTFLNPQFNPEYDYTWTPSFGIIDLLTDPNPRVSPSSTTLYTALVQSGDCSLEKEVLVIVHPLPVVTEISANPNPVPIPTTSGLLVQFDPPDAMVSWSPAEFLDNPFVNNPIALVDENMVFTVEITTEEGCTTLDSIELETLGLPCEVPYVFLPNAFSPNGDGQNEILYLRGVHIEQFELIIYNRWGQQVFRTTDLERGWDGTFNGEDQPIGAFGYYLKVECIGGERFSKRGNVNLIR